ncbi:MAG TPA: hypothetical protein PKL24_23835 [Polyangiaceae bacterium]|nr:hypothetical protein [Polyangiaceae bacterium]HOD24967.1 hypothetical protein [Polyangiaceae bacterium]HOE51902.1 hypothetical protein [Polyangiaceae bacterium]HOH03298.1 hypothetical protein [Polyangiaceae bacterium]HPB96432.1 hypothetical protein [Polyangiaceae bacterium]
MRFSNPGTEASARCESSSLPLPSSRAAVGVPYRTSRRGEDVRFLAAADLIVDAGYRLVPRYGVPLKNKRN